MYRLLSFLLFLLYNRMIVVLCTAYYLFSSFYIIAGFSRSYLIPGRIPSDLRICFVEADSLYLEISIFPRTILQYIYICIIVLLNTTEHSTISIHINLQHRDNFIYLLYDNNIYIIHLYFILSNVSLNFGQCIVEYYCGKNVK